MSRSILLLALCLPLLGARCSRSPGEAAPFDTPVRVVVRNDYTSVMEISAVGSGTRQRLGVVHPGMSGDFEVPRTVVGSGSVVFEAVATNGDRARSGSLNLQPGQEVEFRISRQLYNSTATIRP